LNNAVGHPLVRFGEVDRICQFNRYEIKKWGCFTHSQTCTLTLKEKRENDELISSFKILYRETRQCRFFGKVE
jgi:hypothetical protein